MADVNEWSPLEDGNTSLDQFSLERQISPESELNRYTKKLMAAVRAKTDAMQAEIDTGVVHIDGDETVGGVKTFAEPIVGDVSTTAAGGAAARLLSDRASDVVSVKDFGAVGDGVTDDTAAVTAAAATGKPVHFPAGTYLVDAAYNPDFYMCGPGQIAKAQGSAGGSDVCYNPIRDVAVYAPSLYQRTMQGITYPLPQQSSYNGNCYVTAFAPGSALRDASKHIKYVSAFGIGCGSAPLDWQFTDCFGTDAMMYAGYSSRNVALGSEVMAWGGAPDQQWLRTYNHDWWRKPADNPFVPGEPGWAANTLEAKFPGIGTRIDQFADYATEGDDFTNNTAAGRDAGCHIVHGYGNSFFGYGAGAEVFDGHGNAAIGQNALRDAVFVQNATAVGAYAGRDNLDGEGNTFIGCAAGRTVQGGTGAVVVGYFAADGTTTSADDAIIIGHNAGKSIANLDNCLFIGTSATVPAIGGDLASNKIGINLAPSSVRARLHLCGSTPTGSSRAPHYDGLLVDGGYSAGVTLETTGYAGIFFASATKTTAGGFTYAHGSNSITVRTNNTDVVRFTDSAFRPMPNDSSINLGQAGNLWKEVFAAAGTINTSDARQKANVADPDEALLRAWGRVGVRVFQMRDAIDQKGEEAARLHVGVVAQEVQTAFEAEGLDASRYGLFCHDEWAAQPEERDETGRVMEPAREAGDRYGIRYAEALALECACLRRRLERIEAIMEV